VSGQPEKGTWNRFRRAALSLSIALATMMFSGAGATLAAPEDAGGVLSRISAIVPADVSPHFNTILYVSKARSGPWAQRMFVFRRDAYGEFALADEFAVSTGREKQEKYFTSTPAGIFKLDPNRMFRMHLSKTWDNAPMPYAMFLDVSYRDGATGIALHAATGSGNAMLGRRASGGCVRMPAAKVKRLFEEIRQGRHDGMVPEFAWDAARGRTSTDGVIVYNYYGEPVLERGISVLLVIDEFSGREAIADAAERARG
jgi:hypothetical protein